MGREIRRVPSDWVHPKGCKYDASRHKPLHNKTYKMACEEYINFKN
jgi:hypothetical protein